MALFSIDTTDRDVNVDKILQQAIKEPVDSDVAVILLKIDHQFTAKPSYELKIWGKSMVDWVKLAFDSCPTQEIACDIEDEILTLIKPYLGEQKYTAVFYADTPLLQRRTFLTIIDYVKTKRLNVCKLKRGYVFVTDYVANANKLYSSIDSNLDTGEDLFLVDSMDTAQEAKQKLHQKILDFHKSQGVNFLDEKSTFIDADVVIGQNVTIYPNNVIEGKSIIGDNVLLKMGNNIVNSRLGDDCTAIYDVVVNSDIAPDTDLEPFSNIYLGKKGR